MKQTKLTKLFPGNDRGAVALITVIFLALLLTIITTGFIRLTINERRQSTDDDLTKRAFFAAESGVEDAKIALTEWLNNPAYSTSDLRGNVCDPAVVPGVTNPERLITESGLETEYICQLIDTNLSVFEDSLDAWDSVQVPLRSNSNFDRVVIDWHLTAPPPDGDGSSSLINSSPGDLPTEAAWLSANYPALMRAHVVSYPESGSFNIGAFNNHVGFFMPTASSGTNSRSLNDLDSDPKRFVTCGAATQGTYRCSITITGLDTTGGNARSYVLRLRSLYRSSHFQVQLFNGGNPVAITSAQALIDVTGQAGDVFRRVQVRVNLDEQDVLPDYAILSADEICKRFFITDDVDDFDQRCSTNGAGPGLNGVAEFGECDVNPADCPSGGDGPGGPPNDYGKRLVNTSNNPNSIVAGCIWNWGDGSAPYNYTGAGNPNTPGNDECYQGGWVYHTYDDTQPDRCYTATLTIRFSNGLTDAVYTSRFAIPKSSTISC
ncbi:MAG TPA: hypothetical protein VGA08_00585 [Candidatus Saccharimonadales bacterium]